MKKIIVIGLLFGALAIGLCGCGGKQTKEQSNTEDQEQATRFIPKGDGTTTYTLDQEGNPIPHQ